MGGILSSDFFCIFSQSKALKIKNFSVGPNYSGLSFTNYKESLLKNVVEVEKTDLLDTFQGFYDFVKENVLGVFFAFYGGWGFNNLRVENSTFLLLSTDFLP